MIYIKCSLKPFNKITFFKQSLHVLACPKDSYKSEISNNGCMRCPAYSIAESAGMIECTCMSGFYRADSLFSSDKQCSSKFCSNQSVQN